MRIMTIEPKSGLEVQQNLITRSMLAQGTTGSHSVCCKNSNGLSYSGCDFFNSQGIE